MHWQVLCQLAPHETAVEPATTLGMASLGVVRELVSALQRAQLPRRRMPGLPESVIRGAAGAFCAVSYPVNSGKTPLLWLDTLLSNPYPLVCNAGSSSSTGCVGLCCIPGQSATGPNSSDASVCLNTTHCAFFLAIPICLAHQVAGALVAIVRHCAGCREVLAAGSSKWKPDQVLVPESTLAGRLEHVL